ncbi:hypothetical protein PoMZ_12964, partial [Pyricularia oryzae]
STSQYQAILHNPIYFLSQIHHLPRSPSIRESRSGMLRQSACSDLQQVALPVR